MDNENKDFQGAENEEILTPEEKVREDIRSKVADAAAEVQDEITSIEDGAQADAELAADAEEYEGEALEEVKPEPVKVTVKRSSFIVSMLCSAVVGALILLLGLQIPKWVAEAPEGKAVATVNGEEITDLDVNYYIYAQAAMYAQKNGISQDELATYDWNQEVDGKVLANTIKEKAVNDAINEVLTIQKGAENGITLSEDEISQIETQISGISATYGEDGFTLRTRTMGVSSPKQYKKMYNKVMTVQKVQEDMETNPTSYYPEDDSVLNDYIQPDKASVKHILIKNATEAAEGEEAAPAEDKRAIADTVLQRAQSGEDFDALVEEFNEDPGATEAGYTFGTGEMDPAFEEASFALQIGEISGIVESSYGYHIIKRIPGMYELQGYWKAEAGKNIKIKTGKIEKLDVAAVMADIAAATEELNAQTAAASTAE